MSSIWINGDYCPNGNTNIVNPTNNPADKITVYMRLAETRREDAVRGIERATAALREAMGVPPEVRIQIVEGYVDRVEWPAARNWSAFRDCVSRQQTS